MFDGNKLLIMKEYFNRIEFEIVTTNFHEFLHH